MTGGVGSASCTGVEAPTAAGTDRSAATRPAGPPRRRWAALVVLLVAAAVVSFVVHGMATDPDTGGYPQRIGFERPSDALPDRTAPLAGTLYDNDFGTGRYLGVTATGDLWELPGGSNLLSPTGRLLLISAEDRLLFHDLSTGDRRVFAGVAATMDLDRDAGYWSEDESSVMGTFRVGKRPARTPAMVLDIATGALTEVGGGAPAGFRSPSDVVTVDIGAGDDDARIVVTTTDLTTSRSTELTLRPATPWRGSSDGPAASVSPDGQTLLLVETAGDNVPQEATVRLFSLADGKEVDSRGVTDWDGCAPAWLGDDPVIPTKSSATGNSVAAGAQQLTDGGTRSLVAVHPRLQSSCLQLTAEALRVGPRWAFFGTSMFPLTWVWLPCLIVGTVLLLVGSYTWRSPRRVR